MIWILREWKLFRTLKNIEKTVNHNENRAKKYFLQFKAFAYSKVCWKCSRNSFSMFGNAAHPKAPSGFVPEIKKRLKFQVFSSFDHGNKQNPNDLAEFIAH